MPTVYSIYIRDEKQFIIPCSYRHVSITEVLPTARHVLFVGHQLSNNNTQVRRTSPSPDGTQARSCAEVDTFRNAHTSTPCGKSASVLAALLAPMRNFRGTIRRADPERRCEGHNTVTLTKGRTGDHQPYHLCEANTTAYCLCRWFQN